MRILFLSVLIALGACTPLSLTPIQPSPAPLERTVIDEKGLLATWAAFDVVLASVDGLIASKVIVPGSPSALAIKGHIKTTQNALNAATAAQRAGSAKNYFAAMIEAEKAFRLVATTLKGI